MFRPVLTNTIGGTMLTALMVTASVERADADLGDALVGAGAAVIIGCATGAFNCKNKNSRNTRSTQQRSTRPTMSAAQRQQNMDMQSALNAFGFNAGPVDGVPGRKSRAAIRGYQNYMGYPVTGQLDDWQRQTLIDSWRKYNSGAGNAYPRTMAAVGPRGLLKTAIDPTYPQQFGDNVAGYPNTNGVNNGGTWPQPQPGYQPDQTAGFQPPQAVQPSVNPAQPEGEVVGAAAVPKLKPLKPIGQVATSVAARCELVDQTTRIQGGVIQAANMSDANQALSEKFCEARGFAITQGQSVAAQFAVSENELTNVCGQIEDAFASLRAQLPNASPAEATATIKTTANQLGLSDPATASAYGQICLGIGYRLDNAEMALSGALTLVAADQEPYGEIIAHHLREGFGVTAAPAAAVPWYQNAVTALENGATPVFVPSTTVDRIQVIRAALKLQEQRAGTGQTIKPIKASSQFPVLQPIKN